MKYRSGYSFTFGFGLPEEIQIPFQLDFENKMFLISEIDEKRQYGTGFIEGQIDPQVLILSENRTTIAGTTVSPRLIVNETKELFDAVSRIVQALSFVTDTPIRLSRLLPVDEIIPEGNDDEKCLDAFGTREIHHPLRAVPNLRTFVGAELREDYFDRLGEKGAGIALYQQALLEQEPTGEYRDLWRVLESAFGVQDDELVDCLSKYQAAQQLNFSEQEIKSLLILRGRASHASSKAGIEEINFVNQAVSEKMPRLKCLVEQVLLTKKTWGFQSLAIDRLAPIMSYIAADGSIIIKQ